MEKNISSVSKSRGFSIRHEEATNSWDSPRDICAQVALVDLAKKVRAQRMLIQNALSLGPSATMHPIVILCHIYHLSMIRWRRCREAGRKAKRAERALSNAQKEMGAPFLFWGFLSPSDWTACTAWLFVWTALKIVHAHAWTQSNSAYPRLPTLVFLPQFWAPAEKQTKQNMATWTKEMDDEMRKAWDICEVSMQVVYHARFR